MKRVVIALGGNALGNNLPEQMRAVKITAKAIADLIEDGLEVIISHGNGPQVGMIYSAMEHFTVDFPELTTVPMSVCVGMSQGYIGYDLQNALREELLDRGINKPICSLITQTLVDGNDPAFSKPTKPIGRFMSEDEAAAAAAQGVSVMEDAGRGWRRVIASPKPIDIIEIETVRTLVDAGQVVIAGGGGGIPVSAIGNHLTGKGAVVDKDFASCLMARKLNADFLIILTAVEKAAINWGKPNQKWLGEITVDEAEKYIAEGHFAPGSMLPKMQAAVDFAKNGNGKSLITLLEKARDGIAGKTGTIIVN